MFAKIVQPLLIFCLMLFALPGWAEDDKAAAPQVLYLDLTPAFVTNFSSNEGKKLNFIKVDVSVRANSQQAIDLVKGHDALVRHQLVMLLSRQTEVSLAGSGQELIRQEGLKLVQTALEAETGNSQIDDLLFTSFVVQR
jgi:flagellar protein FliL